MAEAEGSETASFPRYRRDLPLANKRDADHRAVRELYVNPSNRFLLHELILTEAFSLLSKRVNKGAAIQTIHVLRSSYRVEKVPLTPDLLEAGRQRCLRYADKDWDWIDCVSFALMDARGVRQALSQDRHFAQAGFASLFP